MGLGYVEARSSCLLDALAGVRCSLHRLSFPKGYGPQTFLEETWRDSQRPICQTQELGNWKQERGKGFLGLCALVPLPEVALGPSVTVSALSQTLSSSLILLWFGAYQGLCSSLYFSHELESKGKWLGSEEWQPMASLWGLV